MMGMSEGIDNGTGRHELELHSLELQTATRWLQASCCLCHEFPRIFPRKTGSELALRDKPGKLVCYICPGRYHLGTTKSNCWWKPLCQVRKPHPQCPKISGVHHVLRPTWKTRVFMTSWWMWQLDNQLLIVYHHEVTQVSPIRHPNKVTWNAIWHL